MKNLDPHLEILWISDIHYHKDYKNKCYHVELGEFLQKFHIYIKDLNIKFDYFIFSGDISQNGEDEDYKCFYNDILNQLHDLFPATKLIVVPGNHDVSRGAVEFIQDFITDSKDRVKFLSQRKEKFEKIFEPYSLNFNSSKSIPNNSLDSYKKNLLYGYVLDMTNKVIFVMLNSAWYSVGNVFIEHYINNKLYNTKDTAGIISDIKKITSEYGFQTLGLDILDEVKNIIEILNKYPEFLTITIIHHPINWLIPSDQITTNNTNFHIIKEYTDLLLTGHEHVSIFHPVEYINDGDILHLKAGCFMDFSKTHNDEGNTVNQLNPFVVKNNWFSTISINTKKRTVKQEKHLFCKDSKIWKKVEKPNVKKLRKYHDFYISKERFSSIKDQVLVNLSLIIDSSFPNSTKTITENVFRSPNSLIIFNLSEDVIIDNIFIKEEFKRKPFNRLYIIFVDIFNDTSKLYLSKNRLEVINKIKIDYDFKFNKFRKDFFSGLNSEEVIEYNKLEFANIILPYWEIEYLICK